ncbi:hypothetical protein P8452_36641 [Trifolium repens]|jgi:hypothetical protein|nr:hypothetical protein P8452_36641 [Trifolium repens]
MASTPQKEKANLPPKRGKIKAHIFNSMIKFVASSISTDGKSKENGDSKDGSGGSTTSTPPPSTYNSDVSS